MTNRPEQFSYAYSAKEQEEIKNIRKKYITTDEDKLEQLRRIDASTTQKGTAMALIVGILSSLIFGIGMSMIMVWGGDLMLPGILIGVVGLIGVVMAYPIHLTVTKCEREKVASEVIRLTDELMK
ncbi:MAG: hypothetical protein IKL92_00300 [Oscillospiraceae bacterium]|nr:hypothetical protein [Oscillospiraceae bacterium]